MYKLLVLLDIGKSRQAVPVMYPKHFRKHMKKKIDWAEVFALIVSGIGFICLYAAIAIWYGAEVHI